MKSVKPTDATLALRKLLVPNLETGWVIIKTQRQSILQVSPRFTNHSV
jgi:hypothetical protein